MSGVDKKMFVYTKNGLASLCFSCNLKMVQFECTDFYLQMETRMFLISFSSVEKMLQILQPLSKGVFTGTVSLPTKK